MTWYVLEAGKPVGPLDLASMERMVREGRLLESTQICPTGASRWNLASEDATIAALMGATTQVEMSQMRTAHTTRGRLGDLAAPATSATIPPFTLAAATQLIAESFGSRWPLLLRTGAVWGCLSVVCGIPMALPRLILSSKTEPATPAAIAACAILTLASIVMLGGPLFSGMVIAGANILRGTAAPADVFLGFRRYRTVLAASCISLLVSMMAIGAALIPGMMLLILGTWRAPASPELAALGFMLLAAGGLLACVALLPRVLLMGPLAADPSRPPEGVYETAVCSWTGTRHVFLPIGGLMTALAIAAVVSACLVVGFPLMGLPLIVAGHGAIYAMVFPPERQTPSP